MHWKYVNPGLGDDLHVLLAPLLLEAVEGVFSLLTGCGGVDRLSSDMY